MNLGTDFNGTRDHILVSDGSGSLQTTSPPLVLAHTQEFKVVLRLTVSRPVCLGVKPPRGAQDQIFC
jgi:hypothetical protein